MLRLELRVGKSRLTHKHTFGTAIHHKRKNKGWGRKKGLLILSTLEGGKLTFTPVSKSRHNGVCLLLNKKGGEGSEYLDFAGGRFSRGKRELGRR